MNSSRSSRISCRLDAWLERLARFAIRRRWLVIGLLAVSTAGLAALLPRMTVEASAQSYLHPDSASRVRYDAFRDAFGRDDAALVVVAAPDLFDEGFLKRLRSLHREIEREVPFVDEVTSLQNARSTWAEGDRLIVGELMPAAPETEAERARARARALANPLYQGTLLSRSGTATSLVLDLATFKHDPIVDELGGFGGGAGTQRELVSTDDMREMAKALRGVVARYDAPDFRIDVGGDSVFTAHVAESLEADVARSSLLSALCVAVLLFIVFRRVSAVVLPLVVIGASLVSTHGMMVWLGVPLSSPLEILPPLLLTVGVCGTVHLLTIFDRALRRGASRNDAIVEATRHSGLAVAMASMTTGVGLASFLSAEVRPVAHVGLIAPLGVALTLVYTLLLLPALLSLWPSRKSRAASFTPILAGALARIGATASRHAGWVLFATLVVVVALGSGMGRLHFDQNALDWLPSGDPLRRGTELIDRDFAGAMTVEVLLDTGVENGLHEPATLAAIERAVSRAEAIREGEIAIGKTLSIVDILKETHRALHQGDERAYVLPTRRDLVSQELLLFESGGSDDLDDFTDPAHRVARLSMRVPEEDAMGYVRFGRRLQSELEASLGPDVRVEVTGLMTLLSESLAHIVTSTTRSYLIALLAITPMMILLVGRIRLGLLSMIPNLVPVVIVLGTMGWLGIALDASSLLLGSILLGLAVDDTIHFFHRFQRAFEETGDVPVAIRQTLETTGVALLTTSVVLIAGFLSFALAHMQNVVVFGLLAAFATATAFAADLLVAPALLSLGVRRVGAADEGARVPASRSGEMEPEPGAIG